MEINKQFWKITITAFVLCLIAQILTLFIFIIRRSMLFDPDFQIIILLGYLNMSITYTIAPILIFAVFYLIGKNPNFTFEVKALFWGLFIGNFLSLFLSSIISSVAANLLSVSDIASYWGQLLLTLLPTFVLSAFAGSSIGHIRRKNLTMKAEPQPSSNI